MGGGGVGIGKKSRGNKGQNVTYRNRSLGAFDD